VQSDCPFVRRWLETVAASCGDGGRLSQIVTCFDTMDEEDVAFFRKRMVDRESQRIIEGEEMNEDLIRLICATNDGYETPELNDKLYLHFKGFSKICNLEKFTACRSLWLESNRIEKIENIGHMKELASLFLHNNRISRIENLSSLTDLVTLNLSANHIEKVEGLSSLKRLQTLNLSKNLLSSAESVQHLTECQSITNLDVSANHIDDESVLEVFALMKELTQLYLHGNDVVKTTRHYRKRVLLSLPQLTYLDQRPVFAKERATITAWGEGGREAEAQAVKDYRQSVRDKENERRESFRKWKAEQAQIGEANRKAGIVTKPMVSYVNVNSDRVTSDDFPPNSHYVRAGIVPLSHNSRPVASTEDNIALYGANTGDVPLPAPKSSAAPKLPAASAAEDEGGAARTDDGDADDVPPALPKAQAQDEASAETSAGGKASPSDWNDEIDELLAKLVRKHAFDFAAVAKALKKKLKKRGGGDFVTDESCRLRWCGLDYLRYKQTAVESPRKADSEQNNAGENVVEPILPAAILDLPAETDMDELD